MTSFTGALSTAAILSPDANAAIAQVDFVDNQITASGGFQLFSDIDFDGDSDFFISAAVFSNGGGFTVYSGRVNIEGQLNQGRSSTGGINNIDFVNGVNGVSNGFLSVTLTGSSALGDNHQGFLEIRTESDAGPLNGVYIERFVYDDASATTNLADIDLDTEYTSVGTTTVSMTTINPASPIPEASSIAMLAAGAGGLMMRRRRQQAA